MPDWRRRLYDSYVSSGQGGGDSSKGYRSGAPYINQLIQRHIPADRNISILDLGCGTGGVIYWLKRAGYENVSGMPICTLGRFEIDPALLVPMLSSYRSATREIFGAGMRSTAIEGGRWLCFVPGQFTTMLAVFSSEPAGKQLEFLDELHRLFEQANRRRLSASPLDPAKLMFPHEYYLGEWRR